MALRPNERLTAVGTTLETQLEYKSVISYAVQIHGGDGSLRMVESWQLAADR